MIVKFVYSASTAGAEYYSVPDDRTGEDNLSRFFQLAGDLKKERIKDVPDNSMVFCHARSRRGEEMNFLINAGYYQHVLEKFVGLPIPQLFKALETIAHYER